jgi:SAM-dependent methyltransferase
MREKILSTSPGVQVLDGLSTSIPVESGSQDAVVVAQAFHWFANVPSLREIHRVLKPGGAVALIWNMENRFKAKWVAQLRDLYEELELGTPQYRLKLYETLWDEVEAQQLFHLPTRKLQFDHYVLNTPDMIWQRVLSKSYVACRTDQEKEELRKKVMDVLANADDLHYLVRRGESIEQSPVFYPYYTDLEYFFKKQ